MIYLISIIIFYLVIYCFLLGSFLFIFSSKKNKIDTSNKISIIIAAKNESKNIASLAESLNKLDYPKENFEIVFIDDNSIDNTRHDFESLIDKDVKYKIVDAADKQFAGKKGALEIGIRNCSHPFILVTDADCIVPVNWLKCYSNKFMKGYDFIIGIAPFINSKSFTSALSCFENMRSIFLSFSLSKIGLPYNAAARNIGFRKDAYKKVLGYKNTTETISGDDDLLLREMVRNKLKIGLLTEKDAFVFSAPENTLSDFFRQRARHTTTSFHYLTSAKIILSVWHLLNIVFLFSPILIFVNNLFLLPFIIKISADILVILLTQEKIKYNFELYQIIYLQVCYELLLIISLYNARFKTITWK